MEDKYSYLAFDDNWFEKNQKSLLFLCNHKYTKEIFRYLLRINECDCPKQENIYKLMPHGFTIRAGGNQYITDFRTHQKYSKRIYYSMKPIWWMLHYWDELFADNYVPKLSFGFDTLTAYPQAGSGGSNVTTDETVWNWRGGYTWANISSGNGTEVQNNATDYAVNAWADGTNTFLALIRGFFSFNTAALTSSASISATVWSVDIDNYGDTFTTPTSMDIVESTQAAANVLATTDFSSFVKTSFASLSINSATYGVYNDFTFNASGRSAVSKTGVTKTAAVTNWCITGTPTVANEQQAFIHSYFADQTGTTHDPKLVVTYTITAAASAGGPSSSSYGNPTFY